jgi:hypothetical protein
MFGGRETSCIYAWTHMQCKEKKRRKQGGERKETKGYQTPRLLWIFLAPERKRSHERLALLLQA